jgi:hypothetical protein
MSWLSLFYLILHPFVMNGGYVLMNPLQALLSMVIDTILYTSGRELSAELTVTRAY